MNKVGTQDFTCRKCHRGEPEVHFSKCKNYSNGLNRWCKGCQKEFYQEWLKANHAKVSARQAAWYKKRQLERRAECLGDTNESITQSSGVPTVEQSKNVDLTTIGALRPMITLSGIASRAPRITSESTT
jgi:hypothetical protein